MSHCVGRVSRLKASGVAEDKRDKVCAWSCELLFLTNRKGREVRE
ncbi:hypothetical protein [Nostoc sp. T09]|nr:hypothetical protein [Nostoc sp. T09]